LEAMGNREGAIFGGEKKIKGGAGLRQEQSYFVVEIKQGRRKGAPLEGGTLHARVLKARKRELKDAWNRLA